MIRSSIALLVVVVATGLASEAVAQDAGAGDRRSRELALRFMQVTGVATQAGQLAYGLMADVVQRHPQVPAEVWDELHAAMTEDIVERSIPIYTRNFSEGDLAELVAFYESDLGRKLLERTPVIIQETAAAFQGWSESKLAEMHGELSKRGYQPQAPQAPGPPQQLPQ